VVFCYGSLSRLRNQLNSVLPTSPLDQVLSHLLRGCFLSIIPFHSYFFNLSPSMTSSHQHKVCSGFSHPQNKSIISPSTFQLLLSHLPSNCKTPWLSKLTISQFFTFHSLLNVLQSGSFQPTETICAKVTMSLLLNLMEISQLILPLDTANIFSLKDSLPLAFMTLYPSFL